MKTIEFIPENANNKWVDVEVHPVYNGGDYCEICQEGKETFWSVYLHLKEGGILCVADLPSQKLAYKLAELIENAATNIVYDKISQSLGNAK